MVAEVIRISAWTETMVNKVTRPSCPNTIPTSGTPIMMLLLKQLARARAAPSVVKPCSSKVVTNSRPAALK